jgi:hypothetical protein
MKLVTREERNKFVQIPESEDKWMGIFLPYDDFPNEDELVQVLYKNGQVFYYKGEENKKFSHTLHEFYVVGNDHKAFFEATLGDQFPVEKVGIRVREPYISSVFLQKINNVDSQLALGLAKSLLKSFTFMECMKDPDFIQLRHDELLILFSQHINLLEFDMVNWKDYVPVEFRMNVVRYVSSRCTEFSIKYFYPWTRDESQTALKIFLGTLTEEEIEEFQTFDMYAKFEKALDSDHTGMVQG